MELGSKMKLSEILDNLTNERGGLDLDVTQTRILIGAISTLEESNERNRSIVAALRELLRGGGKNETV